MKSFLIVPLILAVVGLAGCASNTKDPDVNNGGVSADRPAQGASISYNLPETLAVLTATYTLESCADLPQPTIETSITTLSMPSSDKKDHFTLNGSALRSFRKDRNVSVSLHSNGAIKTVNSTVTDQTPAIIGGFIKLAATIMAAGATDVRTLDEVKPMSGALGCNTATQGALAMRDLLRKEISTVRSSFVTGDNQDAKIKRINALSAELARLITGPLQVQLKRAVPIVSAPRGGSIKWKDSDFDKWIKKDKKADANSLKHGVDTSGTYMDLFALRYCVYASGEAALSCSDGEETRNVAQLPTDNVSCHKGQKNCPTTIVLREPAQAKIVIAVSAANQIRENVDKFHDADHVIGTAKVFVSQFGELSYLPLSVGFGGKQITGLELDEYGRKSSFSWNSAASGAGFVNGLNTISDNVKSFRSTTADPTDLENQQKTISELETKQKLNRLEACRVIIDNGGYTCPQ